MIEVETIINEIKLLIDRINNVNAKLFRYQHYVWYNYQLIESKNHLEIVFNDYNEYYKKTILQKINKTIEEIQWLKAIITITDEKWSFFRENTLKEASIYYQYEPKSDSYIIDKFKKRIFLRNYELIEDLKFANFNFLKYILLTYNMVFIKTDETETLENLALNSLIETKYKNISLTGSKLEKIFGLPFAKCEMENDKLKVLINLPNKKLLIKHYLLVNNSNLKKLADIINKLSILNENALRLIRKLILINEPQMMIYNKRTNMWNLTQKGSVLLLNIDWQTHLSWIT